MSSPRTEGAEGEEQLTARQRRLVIAGLMLGVSLAAIDLLVIATAVSDITNDLGDLSQVPWIFTAYLLGSAASMLVWGKIGDLFGRRNAFFAAVAIFMVASVIAGASTSMWMLVAGRLLQGIGGGGLLALPPGVIADIISARRRGMYLSATAAVWAMAAVIGPLLGGGIVESVGWRWIFYVNLPTGLLSVAAVAVGLRREPTRREVSIDWTGAALAVSAISLLVIAISLGGEELPWTSSWFIGSMVLVVALSSAWVRSQGRVAEPIVPLSMFSHGVVRSAALTSFFFGLANFGTAVYIPLYALVVKGASPTVAGLTLAPVSIGVFVGSFGAGRVVSTTGHYKSLPAAGAGLFVVGVLMFIGLGRETSLLTAMAVSAVIGLGNGMVSTPVTVAIQNMVPPRDIGSASALAVFARSFGQLLGTAVLGVIVAVRVDHHGDRLGVPASADLDGSPEELKELADELGDVVVATYEAALDDAFFAMAIIAVVAMVCAFTIRQVDLSDTVDAN